MQTDTAPFGVTENAVKQLQTLMQTEPEGSMLRVAVDGGGCSGFQYRFEFTRDKASDDLVLEQSGVKVLIDSVSLDFVKGSALDYIETLGAAHFEVKNPNATASCGCGNSFAV